MTSKETILDFISNFQNEGTIKTFTEGCCYWFALILLERFNMMEQTKEKNACRLMYNQVDGHFACRINGELYDITGEIEYNKNWEEWPDWFMRETSYREVVVRDCIYKTKNDKDD